MKKSLYIVLRLNISMALVWSLVAGLGFNLQVANAENSGNSTTGQFAQSLPKTPKGVERRKFALLVGISKYSRKDSKTGDPWWDLHTKGDVELMADVLIRKFQFKPENIKVICDEEVTVGGKKIAPTSPTHQAIVEAFRTFLTGQVKEGDVAYFHFSGHGQQVPDDDKHGPNPIIGDELDGYDETIIPIDYVSQTDGSKNIRDDEIGILLDELSAKKPSNVTISLDSCFSGTATRGALQRGGDWKGTPVDSKMIRGEDEDAADFVTRGGGSRGGSNGEQNYVFLSAASQKQTAKEVTENKQPYGAFSYALAKAMENSGDRTTYRDLFQKITAAITETQQNQTPQIEGSQLDKIVMQDGALPPQKFVEVKFNPQGVPFFGAGKLQGLTKGSKFNLCAIEAKDCPENEKIAGAEIDNVNPTTATIKLDGNVAPEKLKTAKRAFEKFHNYDDVLKVAVKETGRGSTAKFNDVFANLGIVTKVSADDSSWNILIRESDAVDVTENKVPAGFSGIVLQRQDGSIIKMIPANAADANKQIQDALLAEGNRATIKSLGDTSDASLRNVIKLELIPLENKTDSTTGESLGLQEKSKENLYSRGGKIELKVGDFVRLQITNTGTEDLYVTVLDLSPDGRIGPAFPSRDNKENKITADGKPHPANDFKITEPLGQESFYAIVTRTPTDFTPLISPDLLQRGAMDERGKIAFDSPLGRTLVNAQKGKRGDIVQPPASWGTTPLDFFVISTEEPKEK